MTTCAHVRRPISAPLPLPELSGSDSTNIQAIFKYVPDLAPHEESVQPQS